MNRNLLLTLILGSLASCQALRCYTCAVEASCSDPFDFLSMELTNCPRASRCAKVSVNFQSQYSVSRYCDVANSTLTIGGEDDCTKTKILGVHAETCYCYQDGCNTAACTNFSAALLAVAISTMLFMNVY